MATLHYACLDHAIEEYGAKPSAVNAKVLLLDEPTSDLDTETENLIVERLSQMQDITLVFVSHNSKVLSMSQRLIVLEQGRLLADGLTEKKLPS